MYAFLLSTAVIFVAELGDKSQLMAMTFAARYRARDVLIGITAATALVHLASVGIGRSSWTPSPTTKTSSPWSPESRSRSSRRGPCVVMS